MILHSTAVPTGKTADGCEIFEWDPLAPLKGIAAN